MTDMALPFLSPLQGIQDAALYFLRVDAELEMQSPVTMQQFPKMWQFSHPAAMWMSLQ